MTKSLSLIATGGTIACAEVEGKLESILTADDLMDFARASGFSGGVELNVKSPYQIDSQAFNLDDHGRKMVELLQAIPLNQDVLITTGTDTISWLAALIRNVERGLGFCRKVVILSSMHAPIGEFKSHVGNLMRSGLEVALENALKNGVYVASAQDEAALKVRFYFIRNSQKVAKFPAGNSIKIGGSDWIEVNNFQLGANFRQSLVCDADLKLEEAAFEKFIAGCLMSKLPILSATSPEITAKYCADLSEGDVVAVEVGKSWVNDSGVNQRHLEMVQKFSEKGIRVILNVPSIFQEVTGGFESQLADEDFEEIKNAFEMLENIFVIEKISSDSAYVKLTFLQNNLSSKSSDIGLDENFLDLKPLGLRYLPAINLVNSAIVHPRSSLPKNLVLEGLVDGVVATSFTDALMRAEMKGSQGNVIYSCGTYLATGGESPYSASADLEQMSKVGVKKSMQSASSKMEELSLI